VHAVSFRRILKDPGITSTTEPSTMTEPWQAEGAENGAGQLCSRFVCRVSGAPVDTVDALRAPRALALLSRLAEVEGELRERRESVSSTLFQAIGEAPDKPARNRLITLKRELYNLRPVSGAKLEEGAALLGDEPGAEVRGFQARLEERARIEAELKAVYGEETAQLRARFRELLHDADFRKGLMISSRSLHGALARYQAQGAELSGKDEKTERGLLRYYTRMAAKATPFASFCAIIPGTFVEPSGDFGGELFRFRGDPRAKRSYVRINKLLYGILLDHLKTRPTVRRQLEVELNPTLREEGDRLVFLTAIQSREVFQRLGNNEVLDLITAKIRSREKPTMGDLIDALVTDPQVEASPEEAEAYLDKLVEIGFIRFHTGVGEQDADWDLPFRALLEAMDDDHAHQGAELLAQARERTDAYATADVEGRAAIIEEIHALINGAIERMEIQGRLRRDMPFYEDATADAQAEIPLTPEVRRAFDTFGEWVKVTTRLAWPRPEQATMRHFFDTYYGERRSVPLLQFYEDFYREHFKAHVEKEAKIRAGVQDEELKGYNVGNPYGLEFINRLNASRTRLSEILQARWREAPEAEEITLTAAELEEALQGVETTSGICRSMGAFALLLPPSTGGDDARLLLQGSSYTAGYGKYFSRFLYMLPEDVVEQVRRDNAALTDELLAEICGDAQFNANLHPPLLKWEISYPTGESGEAEQQVHSSDIAVEPDLEDPHNLRLVHGSTGRRVIPVDLGFLNPRMRPPLYQLLSRFTPAVTFAPQIPESPEPPRKPAPRPEAAAEAQAAEGAADGQPVEGQAAGGVAAADQAAQAQPAGGEAEAPPAAAEAAPVPGYPSPEVVREASPADEAAAAQAGGEAPKAEVPPPPPPRVQVRPRISYEGRLILARRRWLVPKALFPQREDHESAADFFVRANRFRLEHGIPETSYLRISPIPEPVAAKPGEAKPAEGEAPAEEQPQAMEENLPGYEAAPAAEEHDEPAEEHAEAAAEGGEPKAEGEEGAEGAEGEKKDAPKQRTQGSRDLHKPQFMDFGNPLLVGLLGKMAANLKNYTAQFEERLPEREGLPHNGDDVYATELVVQLYFPAGTAQAAHAPAGEEDHAAVA
jgi:hypothetical protein